MRIAVLPRWVMTWALFCLLARVLDGQTPGSGGEETAIEPVPAEAVKYHEMLLRRPQAGVVFDRFHDAWLGKGTTEGLKAYLEKRSKEPAAKAGDHLVLALYLVRQGQDAAALAAYTAALKLEPANAPAWTELAKLEARMQDLEGALKSLDAAMTAKPDAGLMLEISKQRARHLLRLGRNEEALKAFRDLLAAHPDDEELAEEVVITQMEEGLPEEAAKGAEALIARTRDAYQKVLRQLLLADIHQKRGSRDEAIAALEAAMQLTGQDTWVEGEVLSRIAQTYRQEDDLEGLAAKLGALGKAQPARVRLAQQHAQVLADLGKMDDAVKVYQDLLERTPGQNAVREGYLNLLESGSRLQEALAQAAALRDQNAGDKEWIIRLASLQHRAGDDAAARDSLDSYLAVKATTEYDRLRAARLLETWMLKDAARAAYEALVKAHPESVSARESQAQFLHRIDEREPALAIWRDIAAKGNLEDCLHVAQTLGARLEFGVALEVLEKQLARTPHEPRLLAALCTAATGAKEYNKAIPWARERVQLAREVTEVEDSVQAAAAILRSAEKEAEVTKELEALPSPAPAERCLLAELKESQKDPAGAEAALAKLTGPDEALGVQELVRLLQSRQEWERAATTLERLVTLPGGRSSTHMQKLVDLRQRAGQSAEALKWIPEWKKLSPGATTPWTVEARILTESSRTDEALKVLREATRKFADNPELAAALGDGLIAAGQPADALPIFEAWYDKTEEVTAKVRWASALARAAMSAGTMEALVNRFHERQRKNRQSILPWMALAEMHRASGNSEGRRKALLEASRLRPQDLDLLLELARLQEDDGLWRESLATLDAAKTLDKGTKVRERQAAIQLRYGDEDTGYRMLFELAGGEQMDARAVERMADGIAMRGEWERVTQFLNPMLERHPRDYRLAYLAAVALEEAGQDRQALDAFIKLMLPSEELPGVVVPEGGVSGTRRNAYQDEMFKSMPPGLEAFTELAQTWGMAYRYRQARGNPLPMATYPGGPVQTAYIAVPPFALSAPSFAAVHVLTLAQSLGSSEKADLTARLKRMDVVEAEMFVNLDWDPQRGGIVVDEDWLQEHADNEAAMAWWIMNNATRLTLPSPKAEVLLRKAFDAFRKPYPGLAAQAAFSARLGTSEEGRKLLTDGLALFSSIEKLDVNLVQLGLGLLQRQPGEFSLKEADEDALIAALQRQLLGADAGAAAFKGWMLTSLGRVLAERERWDQAMQLAQADQTDFEGDSRNNRSATLRLYFGSGSPSQLVMPLPFPAQAAGVSPSALGIVSPTIANSYYYSEEEEPVEIEQNEPMARAASAHLKNETLRSLALLAAGDRDALKRLVEPRVQADPPLLGDVLLMAWEAQQFRDRARAIMWLQRALTLTLTSPERASVEGALVHNASVLVDGKPNPAVPDAARDAAREIARRFARNTSINLHQKQYLARSLEALGLTKEAAQLRNPPQPAAPSVRRGSNPGINAAPATPALVEHLLKKNQREAAAREASRQLRQAVPELFGPNSVYAMSRTQELRDIITRSKLAEEILKAAHPGSPAGSRRMLEYGGIHELLAKNDAALGIYEEVLKLTPRNMDAQMRWVVIKSLTDPAAAASRLASLKQGATINSLLQNLVQAMQNRGSDSDIYQRIAATRTLTAYLHQMAGGPAGLPADLQFTFVTSGPRCIGQAHYSRGRTRLPDIYDASLYQGGDHVDKDELEGLKSEPGRQRREAHDELCRAMLKIPELAEVGFSALAGLALAEKKDLAPINRLAQECLELVSSNESRPRIERARLSGGYSYSSGGNETLWQPKAAEFLIFQAWLDKDPERVEKTILARLHPGEGSSGADAARAFSRLWFGKPEEFTAAAETWAAPLTRTAGEPGWIWFADGGVMENVLRFARMRKLDAPLDDWLIKKIADAIGKNNHMDLECIQPWVQTLEEQGGPVRVIAFVQKLSVQLFGNDEARRTGVTEFLNSRFGNGNSNNARAYSYGRLVESLLQEKTSPVSAIILMAQDKWLENVDAAEQIHYELDEDEVYRDAAALALLLATPSFGGDASAFRGYATKDKDDPTLLGMLLDRIRKKSDLRPKVLTALKASPAPAFGLALSTAALEANPDASLAAFATAHGEDVARLSAPAQDELRQVLKQIWPALKRPQSLPAATQQALEPILAAELKAARERTELVLKAGNLEDLKMEDGAFLDFLKEEILAHVTHRKEDEAVALFEKGCTLIEKKMAAKGWEQGNNWNGWTPRSQLLDEILDTRAGWDLVHFGLRLYNGDASGQLQHPGFPNANKWTETILESWKQEGGYWRPEAALDATLSRVHFNLKGERSILLAPAMTDLISTIPARFRPRLIEWAEREGPKKHWAETARLFVVASRLYFFYSPGKRVKRDDSGQRLPDPDSPFARPEDWEHFRGQLTDESLNPRVRLALANWICAYGKEEVDSGTVRAMAKLSVEGLRKSWAYSAYHLAAVLRCFCQEPVDDAWKQTARELWDAWVLRNSKNGESSEFGRKYDPAETAIFAMWEMAARAREKGWQTRLRADFAGTLNDSYLTFTGLARHGDTEGATTFLREHWRQLIQWVPYYDSLDSVPDNNKAAEGLTSIHHAEARDKFAAACPDPALAEFGKVLMDIGNDQAQSYRDRFGGPPDYRTRRDQAARVFKPENIGDDLMRARATGWFFAASTEHERLMAEVAALAAKFDLSGMSGVKEEQQARWEMLIPLLHSHDRLLAGDIAPFEKLYRSFHEQSGMSDWLREACKTYAARMALSRSRLFWRVQPPEPGKVAATVIPLTDVILKDIPQDEESQVGDALGVRLAACLYDGDAAGLKQWRQSLSPELAKKLKATFQSQSSLLVTLADLVGKNADPKRLPLERRLALVEAALKDEWVQEAAKKAPVNFFKMSQLTGRMFILSRQELVDHGMTIAGWLPREGRSFTEIADYFEQEGREQEMLAALDAAIAAAGNKAQMRIVPLLRKAENLGYLGRFEEGAKLLEGVDTSKVNVIQRNKIERLRKKAAEAAKKQPVPQS